MKHLLACYCGTSSELLIIWITNKLNSVVHSFLPFLFLVEFQYSKVNRVTV